MSYESPYAVSVTSTAGGLAHCSYTDANGVVVPPGVPLTTSTPEGQAGELQFNFVESQNLRLVGAVVKTVGNDPELGSHNYLGATRDAATGLDGVTVPWAVDRYTVRGVVLMFAQVDANGDMVNFFPSTDPQVKNTDAD